MLKAMLVSTAAVTLAGAALFASVPAQAQGLGISVGPDGVRVGEDRPRVERRVIERRSQARRVIVEDDDDEVCETRTRRVVVNGVVRTRRVTSCN